MEGSRVAPPREFEGLLDKLCDKPPLGLALFESKQKVLMFAAALGCHRQRREKVERRGEAIRIEVFQRSADEGFVDALAVAATGDLHVLGDDRLTERITIFEEYAHGGLIELQRLADSGHPLEDLVRVVQEGQFAADTAIPGVDPGVLALLS